MIDEPFHDLYSCDSFSSSKDRSSGRESQVTTVPNYFVWSPFVRAPRNKVATRQEEGRDFNTDRFVGFSCLVTKI